MKKSKGLGISKHRKSGRCTKSPRAKHLMKLDAEKNEVKAKSYKMHKSISDLMSSR